MVIVPKKASSFCIRSTRLLKLREFVPFLKTRLMLLPNDDWVAFCLMPRFAPNMESFWRNSSSLVAPMAVVEVAWVIRSGRASLSVKTRWTTRTVRRRIMVEEEEWYIFFWIVLELMPPMPSISFAWLLPITVAKKWLQIITTRSANSYVSVCVELWKRLLLKLNTIFFFAAKIPKIVNDFSDIFVDVISFALFSGKITKRIWVWPHGNQHNINAYLIQFFLSCSIEKVCRLSFSPWFFWTSFLQGLTMNELAKD